METVTCMVRYFRNVDFSDVNNDVTVNTYYGKNLFENSSAGVMGRAVTELNREDLLENKVWDKDLGRPEVSFASEYRPDEDISSQACVVGRKAQNSVNF